MEKHLFVSVYEGSWVLLCVCVCVLPERRGCLHTVSIELQSAVCSDSTSHTLEALLSENKKTHLQTLD